MPAVVLTPAEVLEELKNNGITLEAAGGQLRFFPQEAVPEAAVVLMREHKAALLELLTPSPRVRPPCPTCGGNDWERTASRWGCALGGEHPDTAPCEYIILEQGRRFCRTCEPVQEGGAA